MYYHTLAKIYDIFSIITSESRYASGKKITSSYLLNIPKAKVLCGILNT